MATRSKDELSKIAEANDLHISPFREDGVTYGTPTWIWSVVVGDALYVRAYNGQSSRWYQAAVRQKALIQRSMASAERSFYKTLAALTKLQNLRGFVPQKTAVELEDFERMGYFPEDLWTDHRDVEPLSRFG